MNQILSLKITLNKTSPAIWQVLVPASATFFDLLLMKEGTTFTYFYDYWMHTVQVERVLDAEEGKVYPVCTDGQLACPPEDSGGVQQGIAKA